MIVGAMERFPGTDGSLDDLQGIIDPFRAFPKSFQIGTVQLAHSLLRTRSEIDPNIDDQHLPSRGGI
jgi:hypothetical protein